MSARPAKIADRALLALVLCAQVAACDLGRDERRAPQRAAPAPPPPPPRRPSSASLREASPAAVLETMRARLRLTPDTRFLSALERLDRLSGNEPTAPVVRFGAGAWQVQIGANVAGMLPELPGFADQYAMVLAHAAQLWKQKNAAPVPGAPAEPILPVPLDHAAGLLYEIEQRWSKGERSPDDARRAALAYVLLGLDLVDDLDVGDALHAQALATVAMAEAASGQPMAREKALLAARMGYAQSAVTIAQALPEDDAVRQFVGGDTQALRARATDPAADDLTRTLAMRALIAAGKPQDVDAFVARATDAIAGSFPALDARAERGAGIDGHLRTAYSALIAMREALGQKTTVPPALRHGGFGLRADAPVAEVATALGVQPAQVMTEADKLLAELEAKPDNAWLPADARVAYHRAQVASALDGIARAQIDRQDVAEQAKQVVAALAAGKGSLAQQLDRYAKDLLRAAQRSLPLEDLIKDIRELRELGLGAIAPLFAPLGQQGAFGSAEQQAAFAIAERCDSRIDCRALLGRIADRNLGDLVTEEALRVSLVGEAPRLDPELTLRHLRMQRDRAGFLAALADRGLPPGLRARQLAAAPAWLEVEEARRAFDALRKEAPASFEVAEAYASWLCDGKDFARALRVIDDWRKAEHDAHSRQAAAARTMRARALQGAGRAQDAWAELQPVLAGADGAVLERAALVRSSAGKTEDAIELARKRLEREPAASSVALLAQLLWRAERGAEAAALLESHADRLDRGDFAGPLANAFEEAHRDRPVAIAVQAYGELRGKKLDPQAVRALIRPGELAPELALRCHELLQAKGELRGHDVAKGYLLMRAVKGEADARAWIEQALPADQRGALARPAYALGLYDLVWELVPDPKPDDPQSASIWLMRSAAFARSQAPGADWKQRLEQYYATHRDALRDRLGLHLLGQVDQANVWAARKGEDDRPECTYGFGLKAQLDGDVAQAVDWYRATLDAGRDKDAVQWADDALSSLRESRKSLAVLTAEAKAEKAAREAAPPDAGAAVPKTGPDAEAKIGAKPEPKARSKAGAPKEAAPDAGAVAPPP